MIIEKELKKLYHELLKQDVAHISLSGSYVTIRLLDETSKLFLSTSVFHGENFIPKSVRKCISQKFVDPRARLRTYLTVDENNFQIVLNYLGSLHSLDNQELKDLLEEFSSCADRWRDILDDHGKNDLVYVSVKH